MLSRLAQEFAAEIANHDWSDAPYRLDRAGHSREHDSKAPAEVLSPQETDRVRMNAMWVVAQVLMHADPNLDVHEFAEACGLPRRLTHNAHGRGEPSGFVDAGIRTVNGRVCRPGTWESDSIGQQDNTLPDIQW
jgi:hypothetical protein